MSAVSCQHHSFKLIEYLKNSKTHYEYSGIQDKLLKSITIHSKMGDPPGLFVPLAGEKEDGHQYIHQYLLAHPDNLALCGNACRDGVEPQDMDRVIFVESPLAALQHMAVTHRLALNNQIVAITGSSGKTTFKNILAAVLREKYRIVSTPGNLNNHIGVPLTLLQLTADTEVAVVELGMNHLGEMSALAQIAKPNIGVIINVGLAHVGHLGSIENVAQAKAELAMDVCSRGGSCYGLTPYQQWFDPAIASKMKWVKPTHRLKGFELSASWQLSYEGVSLNLAQMGVGEESVALAMAVTATLGVSADQFWKGLKSFSTENRGLRGSLSRRGNSWIFLDCYNANPDSFRFSVQRACKLSQDARQAIFIGWYADMAELGEQSEEQHRVVLDLLIQAPFPQKRVRHYFLGTQFTAAFKKDTEEDTEMGRHLRGRELIFLKDGDQARAELDKLMSDGESKFFHVKGSRVAQLEKLFEKYLTS